MTTPAHQPVRFTTERFPNGIRVKADNEEIAYIEWGHEHYTGQSFHTEVSIWFGKFPHAERVIGPSYINRPVEYAIGVWKISAEGRHRIAVDQAWELMESYVHGVVHDEWVLEDPEHRHVSPPFSPGWERHYRAEIERYTADGIAAAKQLAKLIDGDAQALFDGYKTAYRASLVGV